MGKGGGGKSTGKTLFAIGGFFLGGGFFTALGAGSWLGGAVMGASLLSTVWTATHKKSDNLSNDNPSTVQRFDKVQETMSSTATIPVVYGTRKLAGNQTFHETNADLTQLHKHVVLCEGGIQGIKSVCANGLLIPTGTQTSNTAFTLQNVKYSDATCQLLGKHLYVSANGKSHDVYLANKDDSQNETLFEYQVNVSSLVSYLNMLDEGWQAFPVASTNKYPGDLHEVSPRGCYLQPVNFDADTVTGGTAYTFHDCVTPENFADVGGYPNLAWLDMKFFATNELNGNPSVDCVVEGKKVLDPRNGITAYSTNPALCVLDFLVSKRYGLGRWVTMADLDIDSFIKAADYCDEIITFHDADNIPVKGKRYELNMVIDQKQDALTWLQDMLANFCGYLVFSQGKLKLYVESPSPVVYKFNDSNIFDVTIAPLELSETPNKYNISIIDPLNNWKAIKCVVENSADQKVRGKIVPKDVNLDGVTSQNQALRLARFYRDYNLTCPIQLTISTGLQGMHIEPGDVVSVTYRKIFTDMPFRVAEIKETEKNTFEISMRQYNESIYSDDLGGGVQWHKYTDGTGVGGMSAGVPSTITDVIAYTNKDNEILVEHTPSFDSHFKEYRYYIEEVQG